MQQSCINRMLQHTSHEKHHSEPKASPAVPFALRTSHCNARLRDVTGVSGWFNIRGASKSKRLSLESSFPTTTLFRSIGPLDPPPTGTTVLLNAERPRFAISCPLFSSHLLTNTPVQYMEEDNFFFACITMKMYPCMYTVGASQMESSKEASNDASILTYQPCGGVSW